MSAWIDCLSLFDAFCCCCCFCCHGLFVLPGKCSKRSFLYHLNQAGAPWGFLHHDEKLLHNMWNFLSHSAYDFSLDFSWHQKTNCRRANSCLLGWERVMETRAEIHFNWVYTFSAMLSSLRNWANNDRYRLRPSTLAQLSGVYWRKMIKVPNADFRGKSFLVTRPIAFLIPSYTRRMSPQAFSIWELRVFQCLLAKVACVFRCELFYIGLLAYTSFSGVERNRLS